MSAEQTFWGVALSLCYQTLASTIIHIWSFTSGAPVCYRPHVLGSSHRSGPVDPIWAVVGFPGRTALHTQLQGFLG